MTLDFKMALLRSAIVMISFGVIASSCEEVSPDVVGCWVNAYEVGEDIYKSCDSQDFAISRFRQVYDFKSGGVLEYLVLHPTDAHYMAEAKWEFTPSTGKVIIRDTQTNDILRVLKFSAINNQTVNIELLQ